MTQSAVNDENGGNSEDNNNESSPPHPTANTAAQHSNTGSETPLERLTALLPGSNEASESNVAHEMERKLVAWVLLLRMEHDDLCQAWTKHGSDLEEFATTVLLQDNQEYKDKDSDDMILLYLQLVCQVTAQLPVNLYSKPLGESILQVWLIRMEPIWQSPEPCDASPEWLSMVWTNVCSTADIYFQADPDAISKWVAHLFRYFRDFHHSRPTDDARPIEATPPNELSLIEQEELRLMKETLRRVLNRTNKLHVSDIHETMLLLLSRDAVLSRIPADVAIDLLDFVIVNSTSPNIHRPMTMQQTWNQCCLQWILNRTTTTSSSQLSKTAWSSELVRQVLLQRPAFLPHFHKWLLSHVISPDTESMTCRSMTWQVLVTLTHWYGWGWMMTQTIVGMDVPIERTSNNSFGPAKLFCTWMRLASGELRIQLQSILGHQESNNGEDPVGSSSGFCRQVEHHTGEACARLLQGGVAHTIQLAEQLPHVATSLSVDALLHLRQSLEESLWTSVEYLTSNGATPSCSSPLYSAMLSLFGTLLTEVDIFDLIHPNHVRITNLDDDSGGSSSSTDDVVPSPQVILTCLNHILPIVQDPILLPGLVHILSNVQDDGQGRTDPIKLELIQTLLKKSLLTYLECFWRTHSEQNVRKEDSRRPLEDGQILEWALSCTELFSELLDPSTSVEGRCQL